MSTKLTYTKAIKNGKLRATEMQVGESVTGTLLGFKEGKFGSNLVLEVNGREVEIMPAGNLKFVEKDVAAGKRTVGAFTTITRLENKDIKGYSTSQFAITQASEAATAAPAAGNNTANIKARLAEIQAKRTPAN